MVNADGVSRLICLDSVKFLKLILDFCINLTSCLSTDYITTTNCYITCPIWSYSITTPSNTCINCTLPC